MDQASTPPSAAQHAVAPSSAAQPPASAMLQWEYRVIHINVDAGPAPQPADPKTASDHLQGALSPSYLAREFPEHYGKDSDAARRKLHPAEQLQGFLNLLGREGWELTETSQVGPLLMFFFKRPLRPTPKLIEPAREVASAATDTGADGPATGPIQVDPINPAEG